MFDTISEFTNLTPNLIWIVVATSLFAGIIRGFTGFALSAALMAVLSNFIAPIEMVAICLILEIIASLVMMRDGVKNADMRVVWAMVIGSAIGTPIGYFVLTNIDQETSRIVALCVISSLAMLLFMKIKASILEGKAGPYVAGTGAGMANIASVGGMVVALYILARDRAASEMRGTLVMYLMISILGNIIFQLIYGLMTVEAFKRSALMTPFVIFGIMFGSYFFQPSLQKYYKPVCLLVLIGICIADSFDNWFSSMWNQILNFTGLEADILPFFIGAMFLAGLIRGFSGFALSATVMACLSSFIAPIEIIPICFALEILAAIFMFRGGFQDADFSLVKGLAIGNFIGVPIGLFILTQLDVGSSRIVALIMVMGAGTLLLFRVRASFLATQKRPYIGGLTAGIASGIASIGGMVVALFVLTLDKTPKEIRASLIIYLMIAMVSSVTYLILYEIMTFDAVKRAMVASPIMIIGILIGSALFRPSLAKYYRPFCLILLLIICVIALSRQIFV